MFQPISIIEWEVAHNALREARTISVQHTQGWVVDIDFPEETSIVPGHVSQAAAPYPP